MFSDFFDGSSTSLDNLKNFEISFHECCWQFLSVGEIPHTENLFKIYFKMALLVNLLFII